MKALAKFYFKWEWTFDGAIQPWHVNCSISLNLMQNSRKAKAKAEQKNEIPDK